MHKLCAFVILLIVLLLGCPSCSTQTSTSNSSEPTTAPSQSSTSPSTTTPQPIEGELAVRFIDVGQGDAILVDYGEIEVLIDGGDYLLAILNSETARKQAEDLQSRGQWGARDFDKVMLSLPIPPFDGSNQLHQEMAKATGHAEQIAAAVQLSEGMRFVQARQKVRAALREDGVAQKMDNLVTELLGVGP